MTPEPTLLPPGCLTSSWGAIGVSGSHQGPHWITAHKPREGAAKTTAFSTIAISRWIPHSSVPFSGLPSQVTPRPWCPDNSQLSTPRVCGWEPLPSHTVDEAVELFQGAWAPRARMNLQSLFFLPMMFGEQELQSSNPQLFPQCPSPTLRRFFHVFVSSQLSPVAQFSAAAQSCPTLWPHGLQHTRPPCPSPTPGVHPNPCPLSRWCHPTSSSSVILFSFHLQSFPAPGSFLMSQLFASGGQSTGVSASTSVPPKNTQDWSPLGWTGWISLQSKGLSRVFSNTTVQKHQLFCTQLSSESNSPIHTWPLEKP